MKKIIALLSFLLILAGCTSTIGEYKGTSYQLDAPLKDVEIIGLVFVEKRGQEGVYQSLLKESEKLGGNGIVNVMIDIKRKKTSFFDLFTMKYVETWHGSALAIKYTNENLIHKTFEKDCKLAIPAHLRPPSEPAILSD